MSSHYLFGTFCFYFNFMLPLELNESIITINLISEMKTYSQEDVTILAGATKAFTCTFSSAMNPSATW